jgi:hypothetical protein
MSVTTDDRGIYRVFGVAPGTYVVSATPTTGGVGDIVRLSDIELDAAIGELRQQRGNTGAPGRTGGGSPISIAPRVIAFTPVFHPTAFSEDDAVGVTVGFGDERRDVDITVTPVATSTLSGSVVGASPLSPAAITLARRSGENSGPPLTTGPDGTFRITSVVPGRYVVRALISSAAGRGSASGSCQSGETDVQVAGTDLAGIVIALRPCPQLAGRVSFVGTSLPPVDLSTIRMQLRWRATVEAATSTTVPVGGATRFIQTDGTFQVGTRGELRPGLLTFIVDIPGSQPGKGWLLRSVLAEGRDLLDSPLVITDSGPVITPVVITFTDQHSALVGRLETAVRQPAVDYTVIAFTTNQAWWTQPFRRVRTARPATNGDFVFDDLPPGEYFLAALTDIDQEEWQDPGFLAQIATAGTVRITLGEGERKTQDLRMSR